MKNLVVPSGRKCRQKARKLAKLNPNERIMVISKKGNMQYVAIEKSNHFHTWIIEVENGKFRPDKFDSRSLRMFG